VRVAIHVAWPEDEATAQLKWILPQLYLPESPGLRALPRPCVVRTKQVQKIGGFQACCSIGEPFFIDQQGEFDSRFFPEQRGVARITQANGGQVSALALELSLVLAQLRDVLAAKDSTVMAKKNDHSRL
jgi:hypothetical protein